MLCWLVPRRHPFDFSGSLTEATYLKDLLNWQELWSFWEERLQPILHLPQHFTVICVTIIVINFALNHSVLKLATVAHHIAQFTALRTFHARIPIGGFNRSLASSWNQLGEDLIGLWSGTCCSNFCQLEDTILSGPSCTVRSCRWLWRVASGCTFRRARSRETIYRSCCHMAGLAKPLDWHSMVYLSACKVAPSLQLLKHWDHRALRSRFSIRIRSHSSSPDEKYFASAVLSKLGTYQWRLSKWQVLPSFC